MRIIDELFLVAATAWLPEDHEVTPEACRAPALPAGRLPVLRVESLPVARSLAAPEMAILAARECLAEAGRDAADLAALIHTHAYHQGHDEWPVAHYIANELGTSTRTLPLAIQGQFCNGGGVALELASAILHADADAHSVLLTTGDSFQPPGWIRWNKGRPGGFGDGGAAALLTRIAAGASALRLLSVATSSLPSRERHFRNEKEFTPSPRSNKTTVQQDPTAEEAPDQPGLLGEAASMRAGAKDSLTRALADAGIALDDPRIRRVALPRLDQVFMELAYTTVFDDLPQAELVTFGEHTGHLGSGDLFANIVEMRQRCMLGEGDIVLLATWGMGDSWSTAVCEVVAGGPR